MLSKCLYLSHDVKITVIFLSNIKKHGNKFYKLKYNFSFAKEKGLDILTFGGAYSNHLLAVADIGKSIGIKTNAIIRGEKPLLLSPTLKDAEKLGMKLNFISRLDYRKRNNPIFLKELQDQFNNCFIIPEGGSNLLGLKGVNEIINDINVIQPNFDIIILPVATGGTLAGITTSLDSKKNIIGISVLKGNEKKVMKIFMIIMIIIIILKQI
jgi:1-aminocyclopropane-1-carboxylate deaminase/D-cysteine desulfhydrase-like pyridoxal-dependent ACC family enzyme